MTCPQSRLLCDDVLGSSREEYTLPLPECYTKAYDEISQNPDNRIIVAERGGEIIGCMQLVIVPYLVRRGSKRATIEGVRVAASERGKGTGSEMLRRAIDEARAAGCAMVQLDTDMTRTDAHRFYERLGFEATHYGMKMML